MYFDFSRLEYVTGLVFPFVQFRCFKRVFTVKLCTKLIFLKKYDQCRDFLDKLKSVQKEEYYVCGKEENKKDNWRDKVSVFYDEPTLPWTVINDV